jgi:hypothetical protein
MRSFSYFLAACVITLLLLSIIARIVGQPEGRVRRWMEQYPLRAMVIVYDRDGVVLQQLLGGGAGEGSPEVSDEAAIEVTAIASDYTIVAIAGVADRHSGRGLPTEKRHSTGLVTSSGLIRAAARPPRA